MASTFIDFVSAGQLVVWQKKKVRLMVQVRQQYIDFWAGNVVRCGKVDLPESLFDKPLGYLVRSSKSFEASTNFLMAERPLLPWGL